MSAGMAQAAGTGRTKDLISTVSQISHRLMGEVAKVIIGKEENLLRVTVGILSNGNMLLEDFPGLAKTLLANTFAKALGCKFKRVQFTPDLLPSDIMGTYMYDQQSSEFKLRPGPLFTNLLLGDEINRAPPKTQAALLEAMEEKQVTIEGITHKLPAPFVTMATQNPIEQEGTYPLPEAQMDRFAMSFKLGYVSREDEVHILDSQRHGHPLDTLSACITTEDIRLIREASANIRISDELKRYIVDIVAATRGAPSVATGASPRAGITLMKCSQALALIEGQEFVSPDHIQELAVPVTAHRLILGSGMQYSGSQASQIIMEILQELPVPA